MRCTREALSMRAARSSIRFTKCASAPRKARSTRAFLNISIPRAAACTTISPAQIGGFVNEGREVIDSIYKMCLRTEKSKIYPGIPEYFNSEGRGMYHYLTGSDRRLCQ